MLWVRKEGLPQAQVSAGEAVAPVLRPQTLSSRLVATYRCSSICSRLQILQLLRQFWQSSVKFLVLVMHSDGRNADLRTAICPAPKGCYLQKAFCSCVDGGPLCVSLSDGRPRLEPAQVLLVVRLGLWQLLMRGFDDAKGSLLQLARCQCLHRGWLQIALSRGKFTALAD